MIRSSALHTMKNKQKEAEAKFKEGHGFSVTELCLVMTDEQYLRIYKRE
jgi:hypothetical protein